MKKLNYLAAIIIMVLAGSCTKIQQLPPEPYIEYRNFAVFDTTDILGNFCKGGRLRFYFEDGDGNLGLPQPDGTVSDTANLFFTLYRKTSGGMVHVPGDDVLNPSYYRIPFMEREGQNKILKGIISVTFIYLFYEPAANDTVMYEFYLKDRAENLSNTVTTSEIPLSWNGVY